MLVVVGIAYGVTFGVAGAVASGPWWLVVALGVEAGGVVVCYMTGNGSPNAAGGSVVVYWERGNGRGSVSGSEARGSASGSGSGAGSVSGGGRGTGCIVVSGCGLDAV